MAHGQKFQGEIRVASRIVDYLSSGLYKDPAACLKELVNNAYDADANHVGIYVKPDADRIIIEDDGLGMTREQFQAHFDRVSESHKRDESETTPSGRPKIGLIGIGFIAANEICDVMELYSTTNGSTELLHVTIDFAKMRKPAPQRSRSDGVAKADYHGELLEAENDEHYTQLFLKEVRGEAKEILAGVGAGSFETKGTSLYGATVADVRERLVAMSGRTWSDEFDKYSWTMLNVGLNVPVGYLPKWIPGEEAQSAVRDQVQHIESLDFDVTYDATPLRKPILYEGSESIVEAVEYHGENVAFSGYLYAQHGILKPQDLNGVLLRIRNAAVGEFRSDFLGYPSGRFTLFQRWTSAELYVDDRLEDALNIDRRTLRDTHPAYVELQDTFHEILDTFLERARHELYDVPARKRKDEKLERHIREVRSTIGELRTELTDNQVESLGDELEERLEEKRFRNALSRRYSAVDIYEIAIAVARDTLKPEDLERFVRALTRRIG